MAVGQKAEPASPFPILRLLGSLRSATWALAPPMITLGPILAQRPPPGPVVAGPCSCGLKKRGAGFGALCPWCPLFLCVGVGDHSGVGAWGVGCGAFEAAIPRFLNGRSSRIQI